MAGKVFVVVTLGVMVVVAVIGAVAVTAVVTVVVLTGVTRVRPDKVPHATGSVYVMAEHQT